TVAAINRGAKLLGVGPRHAGWARRGHAGVEVRPGRGEGWAVGLSDAWNRRRWGHAWLIRACTSDPDLDGWGSGRPLAASEVGVPATAKDYVAWSETENGPVVATLGADGPDYALFGRFDVATTEGTVICRPVFQLWAEICAHHDPETVEEITGVPAAEVEHTAEMLWQSGPVAYMAWSGLEQQSNATQIARSIGLLYALTGNYDARGGNVEFPAIPAANVQGDEFLSADQRTKTLGRAERPLGVGRFDSICSADL